MPATSTTSFPLPGTPTATVSAAGDRAEDGRNCHQLASWLWAAVTTNAEPTTCRCIWNRRYVPRLTLILFYTILAEQLWSNATNEAKLTPHPVLQHRGVRLEEASSPLVLQAGDGPIQVPLQVDVRDRQD